MLKCEPGRSMGALIVFALCAGSSATPLRAGVPRVAARAAARMVASDGVRLSTFAARVDGAMAELFGAEPTARVRRAWARLDAGEEHELELDPSNALMKQRASSYIEGLLVRPWHEPASQHKWAKKLEQEWKVVRDELAAALADEGALEAQGNNVWAGAKNQTSASAYGQDWKTLALCDRTVWDETNAALFPRTCELLHRAKVPLLEAFFAKMPPRSTIGPHSDMCNFALTAHLGVDVPEGECTLTVGDGTRGWRNGGVMLFDTSILHEAENRADRTRYILMMRVYHHELTVRAARASRCRGWGIGLWPLRRGCARARAATAPARPGSAHTSRPARAGLPGVAPPPRRRSSGRRCSLRSTALTSPSSSTTGTRCASTPSAGARSRPPRAARGRLRCGRRGASGGAARASAGEADGRSRAL